MRHRLQRAKGLALIEFTLTVGMFLAAAALVSDLYSVSRLRSHYDRMSHNLASIIAIQRYVSAQDLNLLISTTLPESDIGEYELNIYNVKLDRSLPWVPLKRGALQGVCPLLSSGGQFRAEMPEEDSEDADTSLIVVQLCRESDGLTLFSALLDNKIIDVVAYSRAREKEIEVDSALAGELGVDEDDND